MIEISKNAGFCFGVRRATDIVEDEISKKEKNRILCTLGKLIHNEQYNSYLKKMGVITLETDQIFEMIEKAKGGTHVTIIIRTHGIEKHIEEILEKGKMESDNLEIIDTSCPYVKKIHKIALENSGDGQIFVLIGQKEHAEVKAIMSYVNGRGYVFSDAGELEDFLRNNNLSDFVINMAAQTTQKLTEWEKCQKIIKKYCTNAKIFDTICSVTEKRQNEAEELSKRCEAMIVIGGKESSNTQKLYTVCKKYCEKSFWVQTAEDIEMNMLGDAKNIGITAGASTPDSLIQEVKEKMSTTNQENFAQMLEEEMAKKAKIYVGATVTGFVMAISENEIRLDLGDKLTGIITRDQITDSNDVKLSDLFNVGDAVDASVISKSDSDGIAILSKKKVDVVKNWTKIVDYAQSGEVVNAKITEATKGGLVAEIDGVRVFIPASMTGVKKDGDLNVLVGETKEVKVVEIKEDKKRAIASIKAVEIAKKNAAKEAFWASIEEGQVFEGPVKSITSYGAFVDLGGVDGLVHITELSWKRIKNPSEVVSVGDVIKVFVKSVDKENGKISLGYKTDDQNPWNIFKSKYELGSVAEVKVVGITTFGAFAEIVPGVDGLIHISQIADQKIEKIEDVIKVGDVANAQITAIDEEKQKVSLSIRALLPKKEEAAEEAAEETEVVEEVAVEEAADAE